MWDSKISVSTGLAEPLGTAHIGALSFLLEILQMSFELASIRREKHLILPILWRTTTLRSIMIFTPANTMVVNNTDLGIRVVKQISLLDSNDATRR